jgi:hypothetical protein
MYQLRTRASVPTGLLLAGLLLAGCAAATGETTATGHVAGRLVMEGGPMGPGGQQPGERPIPGTVTFTAAGHKPVTVKVGSSGAFSVPLPPGRYRVSGRSPAIMEVDGVRNRELPCTQPASATVTAGHTASITLACVVP